MSEPAIVYFPERRGFDLRLADGDLVAGPSIRNAVLLSLFTDRRAEPEDEIPDGSTDRRGYWADAYAEQGDRFGSRLWLLSRAKELPETLRLAKLYAEEALAWMVDVGAARSIEVTARHVRSGVLGLDVVIALADGEQWAEHFPYHLEAA